MITNEMTMEAWNIVSEFMDSYIRDSERDKELDVLAESNELGIEKEAPYDRCDVLAVGLCNLLEAKGSISDDHIRAALVISFVVGVLAAREEARYNLSKFN